MEDQMNQPGTMSPAPQKPKRPAKSQRKGGRLYTIEEANTFAASMCAMMPIFLVLSREYSLGILLSFQSVMRKPTD